jgi:hypothetical protein
VDDPDILARRDERLIVSVRDDGEQLEFQPLNISPWLAMSLLPEDDPSGTRWLGPRASARRLAPRRCRSQLHRMAA